LVKSHHLLAVNDTFRDGKGRKVRFTRSRERKRELGGHFQDIAKEKEIKRDIHGKPRKKEIRTSVNKVLAVGNSMKAR